MSMKRTETPEIFADLDKYYLEKLENIEIDHPRLMVLFSGPPGSGKSTVADTIVATFKGVHLENDAVRTLLAKRYPNLSFDQRGELTYEYNVQLYNRLVGSTRNGLWIIDSSVDRRYEGYYDFAQKHQFAMFLIAMNIPEDIH